MPYIPRTPDERLLTGPLPVVRPRPTAGPENFGGGPAAEAAAGQIHALGREGAALYLQAKQQASDIQENEIDTQLVVEANRRRLELEKVKGKDALPASGESLAGYDAFYQKLAGTVTDPELRRKLDQRYALRRTSFEAFATPYARQQLDQYDDETFKAKMQAHLDAGVLGYQDPVAVKLALSDQEQTLAAFAQRKGLPPEWLAEQLTGSESAMHRDIIQRMLNTGQDLLAKQYFGEHRAKLTAQDLLPIERQVSEGSTLGEAQRRAAEVFDRKREVRGVTPEQGADVWYERGPATFDQALAWIREATAKDDPKVKEAALTEVTKQWHLQQAALEDGQNRAFMDGYNELYKTGSLPAPPKLMDMAPHQQQQLREIAGHLAKAQEPRMTADSWQKWTQLQAMQERDLARVDEAQVYGLRAIFDDSHFEKAIDSWKRAREAIANPKGENEWKSQFSDKERLLRALKGNSTFGITAGDLPDLAKNGNEAQQQVFDDFRKMLDDQTKAFYAKTGRNPKPEEVQQVIDDLVLNQGQVLKIDRPYWFDPEETLYQFNKEAAQGLQGLPPAEAETKRQALIKSAYIPLDRISDADKEALKRLIQSQHGKLSDEKIMRLKWLQLFSGDQKLMEQAAAE